MKTAKLKLAPNVGTEILHQRQMSSAMMETKIIVMDATKIAIWRNVEMVA